jgi:tryptophanase
MIEFIKPHQVNGLQLVEELRQVGVEIADPISGSTYIVDNKIYLAIKPEDTQKAQEVLAAHIAQMPKEPTIEDKLASVGLNLNDLKTALGLA